MSKVKDCNRQLSDVTKLTEIDPESAMGPITYIYNIYTNTLQVIS